MQLASILDYRELARKRLPRFLFDYLDGGSYAEATLRANSRDLEGLALRQRVLKDVSDIDTSVKLFGEEFTLPIGLAPVGLAGMYARRGECQAVRAANDRNIPFALSTVGVCPLEEVAEAATAPFWFQLYMIRDRAFMSDLLSKASIVGCSVLVFTVDMPVPGRRYRDYRSGLAGESMLSGAIRRSTQALMHPRWAWDVGVMGRPHHLGNVAPVLQGNTGLEDFMAWMGSNFDASVSWDDLAFVRDNWDGPIVLKGILDPDDAKIAASLGVDGLLVSNHGGRQLDGAPSSAIALPAIAEAVGDELTVLADSGVRSGLDVLRLLSLGARSVFVGRSWVYGLAARGGQGVREVLEILELELRAAMALTGCPSVRSIDRDILDTTANARSNRRFAEDAS